MANIADKSVQYKDGWKAHQLGVSVHANPYDDKAQYHSNSQWQSGWVDRFNAVKHRGDMELDNE
jgi:hypothetical protein